MEIKTNSHREHLDIVTREILVSKTAWPQGQGRIVPQSSGETLNSLQVLEIQLAQSPARCPMGGPSLISTRMGWLWVFISNSSSQVWFLKKIFRSGNCRSEGTRSSSVGTCGGPCAAPGPHSQGEKHSRLDPAVQDRGIHWSPQWFQHSGNNGRMGSLDHWP